MAQKLIISLLICIIGAFNFAICPAAEQGETLHTYELTGTVIFLDKIQIHLRNELNNNVRFVTYFGITESTQITGDIQIGAVVKVMYNKRKIRNDFILRTASSVELIQPAPATEQGQ
ncbi:MAG: hypothetical protein PHH68_00660 [Candidatus Omnitrophica bacterium]|jgi:hypothetical protein|nr:hypothetical protein [Candidatus Omnitrophota bacterium]MDD5078819.1 hypothetical protein [Candidatus Omnitrophota bacterium]